ncbi:MAG: type phosphodiesterase/nucleotide pyrophosphatase [Phycisphaerales bacterium]|nr:type phosphodiesterase/nucleotide pyrophosphatase [Phycisphaerales bacterium]
MTRPAAAVFARWSWSVAVVGLGLAATASRAVDEGGVADGARPTTQASAAREAVLATQPAWLRPDPFPAGSAAARAATRPSPNLKPAARPASRPVEAITHVLVVSIDGLRPDLLLLADAPNARKLMARGVYSMWAQTTPQSITLPSHLSMLTGVTPNRHGILWNSDLPLEYPLFPNVPTLFEAAKRHGYTTAVAAGKDKFDAFDRPGVLDWRWIPSKGAVKTGAVVGPACDIIKQHKPNAMLVHFPSVDATGHGNGWGSPEQMKAITEADAALGRLVDAMEEAGTADSTLMIISADHGGAMKGHGPEDPRSRHIPWIAVGPGLRKGYDLSLNVKTLVKTEDTFATACWALGIPPTVTNLDGTPVKAIVAPRAGEELMQPSTKPAKEW